MRTRKHKPHVALILIISQVILVLASDCQAATLTITANNGTVIVTPEKAQYDPGETVELIPKPDTGYYFTGWAGDVQGKRLVLNLTMDSNKSITANFTTWQPPIGTPAPPFGITTTHMMYADPSYTYDYGNGPEPYRIGPDGPYTHYIDPGHPNATDVGNPYGTHTTPRVTRPNNMSGREIYGDPLPPGTVFEFHSGVQLGIGGTSLSGTADLPIFFRGVEGDEPTWKSVFSINGDYIIMENFKFDLGDYARRTISIGYSEGARTHIAIRGCEFYNGEYDPQSSYMAIRIKYSFDDPSQLKNIVIYNNHFHNIGDGRTTPVTTDASGISVDASAENIWIVDNHMHHLGGVGIKVSYDSYKVNTFMPNHIYIGRNIIHDNFEHAIGLKVCEDVIISQNIAYNFGEGYTGTIGHGTSGIPFVDGLGEGPDDVGKYNHWYLFNLAYNYNAADGGFAVYTGAGETLADEIYYIGNIVYNSHNAAGTSTAFSSGGSKRVYWINNLAYNCDRGGQFWMDNDDPSQCLALVNNIFSESGSGLRGYLVIGTKTQGPSDFVNLTMSNNLFFQNSGPGKLSFYEWYDPRQRLEHVEYTIDQFKAAKSDKAQSTIEADPLFVDTVNNDFHLLSGSPAIDAGISSGVVQDVFDRFEQLYSIDIRNDIEGNPRTDPWNIGAYESVVDPDNPPPVLQAIGDKSVNENVTLTFTINATDSEPVTYLAQGLPSGATLDPQTGDFAWTPSYTQAGSYQVRFIASDGNSNDSETITITVNNVNRAPILGAISDQSVDENSILSFSVDATDADGQALSYSVSGLPTGAVFASQTLTWTPSFDQAGAFAVTFAADDGQDQDSQEITITVNNVNRTPVLTAIDNQSVWSDDPLTFTVNATDPDGDEIIYSVDTLPSGAAFADQDFDWTPSQDQGGSYAVTFTASDGQLQNSQPITITVNVDSLAPTVTNSSPAADSIQAPLNNLINLNITDAGKGVDADSVTINVNNNIVYSGNTDKHSSIYGECYRVGTKANYRFIYQPNEMFDYDQTVSITASATDLAGNAMNEQPYSFVTEMRSFGENQNVDSRDIKKGRPVTVCDNSGNIWAAWHAGVTGSRDIYIGKLSVDGEYFGDIINLTEESTADQCNPVIAIGSDDKLYVAWQDDREGDWDIYVSTSNDGTTWSTETMVNEPEDDQVNPAPNQVNPVIVIDGENLAYVVWQDDRGGNQDIYVAASNDGFATKTVSQITTDNSDHVEPAVAVDSGNTIYVVWTDTRNNGKKDIYGAASNNGPWTNVAVVTEEDGQSSPAIATEAVGSILHLVWVDDRLGDDDIFYDKTIGGLSPLTGSSIIDDGTGAYQISPVIITTGTENDLMVFACWRDERNADADLYFAEIRTGNETNVFVGDEGTHSDQSEPAVGIDGDGYPYLVWTNERTNICYAGSTYMESAALASTNVSISSTATVGTTWNAVSSIDDVSAEVPQGAYLCDVQITISKIKNPPKSNLELAHFTGTYEFGPSGMEFIEPVTITIPYEVNGENVSYTAYWYNPLTNTLSQQGITDVETIVISSTLHALRFKTTHFSAFILGGAVGGALLGGGGGGGGCSVSAGSEGNIVEFFLPYIAFVVVLAIRTVRDARYRKARSMASGKC